MSKFSIPRLNPLFGVNCAVIKTAPVPPWRSSHSAEVFSSSLNEGRYVAVPRKELELATAPAGAV